MVEESVASEVVALVVGPEPSAAADMLAMRRRREIQARGRATSQDFDIYGSVHKGNVS